MSHHGCVRFSRPQFYSKEKFMLDILPKRPLYSYMYFICVHVYMYIYVYICVCNYIICVTIYNIHVCVLHIYIHTYTLWNIQKYRFVFTIISNRLWSTLLCFSISLLVLWFPSMIHFQSSMKFFSASSQELNIYQLHRKSQKKS